jgi:hypothetical protein
MLSYLMSVAHPRPQAMPRLRFPIVRYDSWAQRGAKHSLPG